jgi:hypothetical protein
VRETPEQHLLGVVRKCAEFVVRGNVTGREFINKVFDEFAHTERVYPEVVPDMWAAVPESIRGEFAEAISYAVGPDFRYHAFYVGGGRPLTEEELQRDADLRTARIQAWARAFVSFLGPLTRRFGEEVIEQVLRGHHLESGRGRPA